MISSSHSSDSGFLPVWWERREDLKYGCLAGANPQRGWNWSVSSKDAIWLWLNLEGDGLIWGELDRLPLKPGMYAITGGAESGKWTCLRQQGAHQLHWVVISRKWLESKLESYADLLRPDLTRWLLDGKAVTFCGLMGHWEKDLAAALVKACSGGGPATLLVEARILEWTAGRWFSKAPMDPRLSSEQLAGPSPVRKAIQWLLRNLDQPLDLRRIAKEINVSPHHLSRRVSAETGMTLSRHLRRLRVEHACEILRSGRTNVTEAALDVGYQSLSHFAKAFREETGRTPSEWLADAGREA
jgi:AraC-like DNA-binding protein